MGSFFVGLIFFLLHDNVFVFKQCSLIKNEKGDRVARIAEIVVSVLAGFLLFLFFKYYLKSEKNRKKICSISWLHPNWICLERAGVALIGLLFYFATDFSFAGILLFTVASFADAIDGVIARGCGLVTKLGEELDPLCDKLTYLPALWLFAYNGFLSYGVMAWLTAVELLGQFAVRSYLKKKGYSPAATKAGKIKAVLCFALVIYCALLDDGLSVPDYSEAMLLACLIMAIASPICKIPWSVKK